MSFKILIGITIVLIIMSIVKSRTRTLEAVKMARGMFLGTFSEIIGVLGIIGILLALLPPELIKEILGGESKIMSTIWGGLIGTISIIPAFIAFPLSKSLFDSGAHLMTIAAFLTTLTMVGVATLPIEIRFFGKNFSIARNAISFIGAIGIAVALGVII